MIGLGEADYNSDSAPLEALDLSVRGYSSLKRIGITTIGELVEMLNRSPNALLAIRNFGEKSLDELVKRLKEQGWLPQDWDFPGR